MAAVVDVVDLTFRRYIPSSGRSESLPYVQTRVLSSSKEDDEVSEEAMECGRLDSWVLEVFSV